MTPKDTIIVPAEIVIDLRTALYTQIGAIAEVLDSLTLKPDRDRHPQRYHQPLQNLDRIRRLLDTIGWSQSNRRTSVELDLGEHRRALVGALQMALTVIDDAAAGDRTTPAPSEEAVRERTYTIRALLGSVHPRGRV
jgi:hypothetical protein